MTSADDLIGEVESMKVRGAFLNAIRALDALEARVDEDGWTRRGLIRQLTVDAARLASANESWAGVALVVGLVVEPFSDPQADPGPVQAIRQLVHFRASMLREKMTCAQSRVAEIGANLIQDGAQVGVMSYSGTLIGIFEQAWRQGKQFSLIGTESRPFCEGREMAGRLAELGIPYTLIADVAQIHHVPWMDLAMVGVDSLQINGDVINKIGTMPLALGCQHYGRPLYAATSLFKMSTASLRGEKAPLKKVDRPELLAEAELLDLPNLTTSNVFFEVTPAGLFEGMITEFGVRKPDEVRALWAETESSLAADLIAKPPARGSR